MQHVCQPHCPCRIDLDRATAALERSTQLLANVSLAESLEIIEAYCAGVRAAEAKLSGAIAAYRDHFSDAATE
jgi:hypothetical protein